MLSSSCCRLHLHQDVDTIYLTQDTRELNLQDFIHLENRYVHSWSSSSSSSSSFNNDSSRLPLFVFLCRDLVAIIAALEHNQWFTKLSTKDYKLVTFIQTLRAAFRGSACCLTDIIFAGRGLHIGSGNGSGGCGSTHHHTCVFSKISL